MAKLLYMTTTELFLKYILHKDLDFPIANTNHEILVISRDIVTAITRGQSHFGGNDITYESKYDNIDFLPSLFPTAQVMEIITNEGCNSGKPRVAYLNQLDNVNGPLTDCIAIVGLLLDNPDITCICVCSDEEMHGYHYLEYLADYMESEFGVMMYTYAEWENDKNVNIGDVDEIKKKYDITKRLAIESNSAGVDILYNRLTEDMSTAIKNKLGKLSVDELAKFANNKGIYVNRRKTKDEIIDVIIKHLS